MLNGPAGHHRVAISASLCAAFHDDVINWKHFLHYWPFVRGIHRSRWIPSTKASDGRALMFSLICARINGWVNNREAGDLRRHRGHYDVNVMLCCMETPFDDVVMGSDNGLSPVRPQAIICTNDGILSIGPLGMKLSEILIKFKHFHSRKCIWKSCLQNGLHFVSALMFFIYVPSFLCHRIHC